MKLYAQNEIATAIALATDNKQVAEEIFGILERLNEDEKFADSYGLKQTLHLKSVALGEK
jgi:hypothetical protein